MSSLHPSSWPCRRGLGLIRGSSPPHSGHPHPHQYGGGMWRGCSEASQPHIISSPSQLPVSPSQVHPFSSLTRKTALGSHWPTFCQPVSFDPFNPQGQRSFLNGLLPGPLSGLSHVLRGKCSLTPGPRELLFHPFPLLPHLALDSSLRPSTSQSFFHILEALPPFLPRHLHPWRPLFPSP